MSSSEPFTSLPGDLSADEVLPVLTKVVQSRALERSPRLQEFLRYITDLTLKGQGDRINETLIAVDVFHRNDYISGEDSTVRRQAHALRQKLERYYAEEGADDPVRIDLPIGRYVPVFRRIGQGAVALTAVPPLEDSLVEQTPTPAAPAPQAPAVTVAREGAPRRSLLWGAGGGAALYFAGVASGRLIPSATQSTARRIPDAVKDLWGDWLRPGGNVTLCFSNTPSLLLKVIPDPASPEAAHGTPVPLEDEDRYRRAFKLAAPGHIYEFPDTAAGKQGEAAGAARLSALFEAAGMTTAVTQSRYMTLASFQERDYVAFGHDENNPLVFELLATRPIQLALPDRDRRRRFVDSAARGREVAEFHNIPNQGPDGLAEEFALITKVAGLGQGRNLLLVTGLSSPATHMAVDYLVDESRARDLASALRQAQGGSMPRHYQAVIRVRARQKIPMQGSVERVRVL